MLATELAPTAMCESKGPIFGGAEPIDGDVVDAIQSRVKKKRKKRKKKEESESGTSSNSMDPLEVFGTDIMLMILSHLDARSVALSLLVSRRWNGVASSDTIWGPKCEELWLGKAHIPRISKLRGLAKLAVYSLAVVDGKRARIMRDDLCDHAWEFHFTEAAPEFWRNLDPYWNGTGPPLRRYFHPDGSQTADPHDQLWGGHEACYCVVTSYLANDKIRQHYVRVNRWPQLYVSRKLDWRWEMSNKLCIYTSIPDPDKPDGTGPLFPVF
nr:F-box family protein [Ipomoea batatas]GMD90755.1 F-box family protein [Ipomoea batatas]